MAHFRYEKDHHELKTGPFETKQGPLRYANPSQTNTGTLGQTKNPPRLTQVPLRPTKCSLGRIEGLHELIEGPLRPARGMTRPTKDLLGALQGLLKSNQACTSLWPAKRTPKPVQGQLRLARAPQNSTGLSLANKMPSCAKSPLRPTKGTFKLKRVICWHERALCWPGKPFVHLRGPLSA